MNEKEQWNKYLEWSYEEFFSSIESHESVLELGPGPGHHSKLILKQDPSYLMLVEPEIFSAQGLKKSIKQKSIQNASIYHNGYEEFFSQRRPFDVVVCCGLLYHLLAPLHLLEKIVNHSTPNKIIISNIDVEEDGVVPYEYDYKHNPLGRSNGMFIQNPLNYWHKLSSGTVKKIMESSGYKCVKELDTKEVWPKNVYYWQMYKWNL